MVEKVYGKYFQKSRSFLYPMLGIRKTSNFTPSGTYISLEGKVAPEDMKLICVFKKDRTEGFQKFENDLLVGNPLFLEKIETKTNNLYIFNFEVFKVDWFNFILGRYSKLSTPVKKAVKVFYGEKSAEYQYMESYIYPEKHFETYAKLLEIDVETLKSIGELCDPCDLEKETLKIPKEELEVSGEVH